ncbi:hypothetical protein PRZ48_013101 [Zasmidium cellare]|uniref:DUF676 domain-containing protein n=1 Tax=Zasmidium cellare TaxID=395010 RepID=A0ABR0E3K4_ZASCE|nr:hypothetical protein PRZ48_013101 [Zasmidium cellare]
MLLQPRLFKLLQQTDSTEPKTSSNFSFFEQPDRTVHERRRLQQARKMLLVHQAGSVKVGEVVRYTLTYTPSNDRILPTPSHLHLKVKNTCAIPLRAAWVHGPYTLHVAAYPATFNPHHKVENPKRDGVPEYEPMVKAGGSWSAKLLVPEDIRETGAHLGRRRSTQSSQNQESEKGSVTWIVEIASQILFSNSASVEFEVFIGRDERSLDFGFAAVAGHGHGGPGKIKEAQSDRERKEARRRGHVQHEGVYSKAVRLVVEDTEALWDKPPLPSWDDEDDKKSRKSINAERKEEEEPKPNKERKRRNVHLVVVTHGLHSNIGADMLFLKESIDATVAQAREDAKKRKEAYKNSQKKGTPEPDSDEPSKQLNEELQGSQDNTATAPLSGGQEERENDAPPEEEDDEEETIVRGFPGNAVKTENGIQYLGKRLAKYILRFTYPDQPFLPIKKNFTRKLTDTFSSAENKAKRDGVPSHEGSNVHTPNQAKKAEDLPYKFTSISFVGHSLGGLIQTYAVAYIHKHSPTFFQQIKPVNFICMASPMLGLSNENPMYVKFALDFGLVGRTGQDLGLTWRPPTIASKGWNAMMGSFGNGNQKDDPNKKQEDPTAKPLLRILPTGPAHQVLKMFRNRTVYSNVVNDGIVPLRTSCLLFLDWRGLGKVEKARRENGLIGTVAEWGWAELTGANASQLPPNVRAEQTFDSEDEQNEHVRQGEGDAVPQPAEDETAEDNKRQTNRISYEEEASDTKSPQSSSPRTSVSRQATPEQNTGGMFSGFFNFFRPNTPDKPKAAPTSKKTTKALRRAQTVYHGDDESSDNVNNDHEDETYHNPTMRPHMPHLHTGQVGKRPAATRGDSLTHSANGELQAPPKTSIFESAGDILHPPLPSRQWITDPSTRSRTIFHDRVYHPEDIPPPPAKRTGTKLMSFGSDGSLKSSQRSNASNSSIKSADTTSSTESGGMKVEEKIARAYHRDLSWRKVLVRLEPDAHNNMVVRRMFANAYGWPVVKHLCDTHFADTHAARTRDEDEPARERAKPMDAPIDPNTGEQVNSQTSKNIPPRTQSETREARDELTALDVSRHGAEGSYSSRKSALSRQESAVWDDSYFEGSDGEDSDAVDERNLVARLINPNPAPLKKPESAYHRPASSHTSPPSTPTSYTDGHRGLAPTSPRSPRSVREVKASTPSKASQKPTFDAEDVETPVVSNQLVEEPEPLVKAPQSPGSTVAEIGLRKSVEEQVSPVKGRPGSKGK